MSEEKQKIETQDWTLLFDTDDDMCHPVRIHFHEPSSEADAVRYASSYLVKNSWLKGLSDCYPTNVAFREAIELNADPT